MLHTNLPLKPGPSAEQNSNSLFSRSLLLFFVSLLQNILISYAVLTVKTLQVIG